MAMCLTCTFFCACECRRYPPGDRGFVLVNGGTWCGEYKGVSYAVEEREVKESDIAEHKRVDPIGEAPDPGDSHSSGKGGEVEEKKEKVRKRGWPKGKPRK